MSTDTDTKARMKSLRERFGMPPHLARQVASGQRSTSDALLEMQRADAAARLLEQGRINSSTAGLIRRGHLTPQEAEFQQRVNELKRSPEYLEYFLDGLLGRDVLVAVVGGGLLRGRLVSVETYDLTLDTADGRVIVAKHDVKLACDAAHRKRLLKRGIAWGPADTALESGALKTFKSRRDVKARDLLQAMEDGGVITWTTAEGDRLRGRVCGFNRFEVVVETAQGAEVFLLRHAFGGMG